eukprot:gene7436-13280_t
MEVDEDEQTGAHTQNGPDGHDAEHGATVNCIAALIYRRPKAPSRRGTRDGDWAITELSDPRPETDTAVARIRAAAHSSFLVTKPWERRVRVYSQHPLAAHVWGGTTPGVLEVIPAGSATAPVRALTQGAWIANIGRHDAYVALHPHNAAPDEDASKPRYVLRIPPWTKAGLVVGLQHPLATSNSHTPHMRAQRLVATEWVEQHAKGVHKLNDMAEMAQERGYDILFIISCGPRRRNILRVGAQWLCYWSQDGGTDQEGVCALVNIKAPVVTTASPHHNVLAISTRSAHAKSVRNDLDIGVYAPGDERWSPTMDVVRRLVGARLGITRVVGDFNTPDPADPDARGGPLNKKIKDFLDDTGLAVMATEADTPTQFGGGPETPHLRRIDHTLLSRAAEREPHSTRIIWDPRYVVDHALVEITPDNTPADEQQDAIAKWRCVNYRPRTTEAKMEWLNAAWLLTRHSTVADPTSELDELLTAAAHAALGQDVTHTLHADVRGAVPAAARAMTPVAQWARDRLRGKTADELTVETVTLTPTDPENPHAGKIDAA